MSSGKKYWLYGVGLRVVALGVLLSTLLAPAASAAPTGAPVGGRIGVPRFTTDAGLTNFPANPDTIPFWASTFTDPTNGMTYRFRMVGTDPARGDVTTVVPTVIIPLRFTFGQSSAPTNVLDGASRVAQTVQSPVFQSANIGAAANASASAPPEGVAPNPRVVNEPSDVTQVGDAIYRAQWGKTGSRYHVLLGQPTVLPTVSFDVPAQLGAMFMDSYSNSPLGLIEYVWFQNRLKEVMRTQHISPRVLPIFLVYNAFLYSGSYDNCCILGFHGDAVLGDGVAGVNTYMFASYSEPGVFPPNPGDSVSYIADIHGLSHEVQEWLDDPFVNNRVNPWQTPAAPQYGCTTLLETGDPVVGYAFTVTMPNGLSYHPEDEVHYSWFAREKPSRATRGYYTYLNNYADVAQGCS